MSADQDEQLDAESRQSDFVRFRMLWHACKDGIPVDQIGAEEMATIAGASGGAVPLDTVRSELIELLREQAVLAAEALVARPNGPRPTARSAVTNSRGTRRRTVPTDIAPARGLGTADVGGTAGSSVGAVGPSLPDTPVPSPQLPQPGPPPGRILKSAPGPLHAVKPTSPMAVASAAAGSPTRALVRSETPPPLADPAPVAVATRAPPALLPAPPLLPDAALALAAIPSTPPPQGAVRVIGARHGPSGVELKILWDSNQMAFLPLEEVRYAWPQLVIDFFVQHLVIKAPPPREPPRAAPTRHSQPPPASASRSFSGTII